MKNKTSKLDFILIILIIFFVICAIINTILFFVNKQYSNIYIIFSLTSLGLIGVLTLILILKNDEGYNYNDFIIMNKNDYIDMKNTLFSQKKEIKDLKLQLKK